MKDVDLDTIKRLSRLLALVFIVYIAYVSLSAQVVPITFHLNDVVSTSTTGPWMFEHDDLGLQGTPLDKVRGDDNCFTFTIPQNQWEQTENYAYRFFGTNEGTTSSCVTENLPFVDGTAGFRVEFDAFTLTGFHKINTVNPLGLWNVHGQAGDKREYTGGVGRIYQTILGVETLVLTVTDCVLDVQTPYPTAAQMRAMFLTYTGLNIPWQQQVGTGLPVTASGRGKVDFAHSNINWANAFANANDNQVDFLLSTINFVIQGTTGYYDFDLGIKAADCRINNRIMQAPAGNTGDVDFSAVDLLMQFEQASGGGSGANLRDISVFEHIEPPAGNLPPAIQQNLNRYWELSTTLNSFTTDVTFDLTGENLGSSNNWRVLRKVTNSDTWEIWNDVTINGNQIRANNVSAFSDWTVGSTEEATLPVELSSFNATVNQAGFVTLNWVTQSETGVLGYRVFRSVEEEINNALLVNSEIITACNTSQTTEYRYTDEENTEYGTWYYWLESIDINGSGDIFGPVTVLLSELNSGDIPIPVSTENIQLTSYPNPFNPHTTISFYMPKSAPAKVAIYNLKGEKVKQYTAGSYATGWNSLAWDGKSTNGSPVSSGVYYIKLQTADQILTKKVILTK